MIKAGPFASRARPEITLGLVLALLAMVVLIPAACVLWFMTRAMQNEQMAVEQKLQKAYRSQLQLWQERLDDFWRDRGRELDQIAQTQSAAQTFAQCVREGLADAVLCFDDEGKLVYPKAPEQVPLATSPVNDAMRQALELERVAGNFPEAARLYEQIAAQAANDHWAAQALQAQARALAKAGQTESALRVLTKELASQRYAGATDTEGRLIFPNALLLALELIGTNNQAAFESVASMLQKRVLDYSDLGMSSSQRRFLMRELQERRPSAMTEDFPEAEALAARLLETEGSLQSARTTSVTGLSTASVTNVWQLASPERHVLALFRSETLRDTLQAVLAPSGEAGDVKIEALPPSTDARPGQFLVSLPAGAMLPGWQLGLALQDQDQFRAAAREKVSVYFWTGTFVVAAIALLALVLAQLLRRQNELARLKNDLVATVTHELKTPLASTRLLVDTLLDAPRLDERTAREYLRLIAKENTRLSHLIDDFLTFSRMERNKYALDFRETTAQEIVSAAADAVRDRLEAAGGALEVNLAPKLPAFRADADALVTVLINLLDNAHKYSGDEKRVRLSAKPRKNEIVFEVQDHGIGISPRETKKIFKRFYQVDQSMSRAAGGCGLGLSIVHFIVTAHRGSIEVESQLGQGSTFKVRIPVGHEASATA